ncbi:DUF2179 domain-containing protein [Planococcus lenghuensis]|uniref:UPF0316 protein B0X71_04385 n=1 Tax=Planococcus lenghuensis TaxID=2213202 RepID=A0A1Q2L3F4_9BACL|nr:DUF2179 domain-containing protein [Planococcus lenghuensis]AQQ54995.1 DUF2179 domain-containing protein [Planococcus lenghuensis]
MATLIFVINIVVITLYTIRMILTMKGYRYIAAAVSIAEVVIYIIGLGLVLANIDQVQNVAAYALGYGTGVIIGMKVEEKLALGYTMVNVITADAHTYLPAQLRQRGYGVTDWQANGLNGNRQAMQILTPRKNELKLYQLIKELDPKAFIISYEPKEIFGGFWTKSIRQQKAA